MTFLGDVDKAGWKWARIGFIAGAIIGGVILGGAALMAGGIGAMLGAGIIGAAVVGTKGFIIGGLVGIITGAIEHFSHQAEAPSATAGPAQNASAISPAPEPELSPTHYRDAVLASRAQAQQNLRGA